MSGGHALHAAGVAGDPASPIHRLDPRAPGMARPCGLLSMPGVLHADTANENVNGGCGS